MPSLPDMPSMPQLPDLPSLPTAGALAQQAAQAVGGALPGGAAGLLGAPAAAMPNIDDLYEGILERLRRDLLAERERMGDLLGDFGH
jgi:hypothetical protein